MKIHKDKVAYDISDRRIKIIDATKRSEFFQDGPESASYRSNGIVLQKNSAIKVGCVQAIFFNISYDHSFVALWNFN